MLRPVWVIWLLVVMDTSRVTLNFFFVQDIEILLLEILNITILFLNFFTKWNFSNMERIII